MARVIRRRFFAHLIALAAVVCAAPVSDAQPKPPPPLKVASKDLVASYLKDAKAAGKKYGDPYNRSDVIVEGVVVGLEDGTYGKLARLEGSGGVVVSCLLRSEDVGKVKKGDTVAIRGWCRGLYEKEKLVDINGGALVKAK